MSQLFCKRNLSGLILAAMTAGAGTLPAAAANHSSQSGTKTAHATISSKSSHSSGATSAKKTAGSHSSKSSRRRKSKKVKGQTAPTPERINQIQEALASKGAFAGTPTGKWDDSTVDAMKKFQASSGLTPTGKLDALTLQKLGLGSETAGVAPPTPPPNWTNRLRNASSLPEDPREP